jgi:hypothetical protein
MPADAGPAYQAVAQLWRAFYDCPPPPGCGAGEILDALIEAMQPLAYDQFYQPYRRAEETSAPPDAPADALPSPARLRALDVALRDMLASCPAPSELRALVEQIDQRTLRRPLMRLDGMEMPDATAARLSH